MRIIGCLQTLTLAWSAMPSSALILGGSKCAKPKTLKAHATIVSASNDVITGCVDFAQDEKTARVEIAGKVQGLSQGDHGFHVHAVGAVGDKCKDAKGHFNPAEKAHGAQDAAERHVGDLGNIQAVLDKSATIRIQDDVVSLKPNFDNNIVGKSIVIHADADDLGKGGVSTSSSTGNAGDRVACAIIKEGACPSDDA